MYNIIFIQKYSDTGMYLDILFLGVIHHLDDPHKIILFNIVFYNYVNNNSQKKYQLEILFEYSYSIIIVQQKNYLYLRIYNIRTVIFVISHHLF